MSIFNLLRRDKSLPDYLTSDSEIRKQRMAEKRQQAIEELGDKYILHPKHKVTKLTTPRGY